MEVFNGTSVCSGITYATIKSFEPKEYISERKQVKKPDLEVKRFLDAKRIALEHLDITYQQASMKIGNLQTANIKQYQRLLEDENLEKSVICLIQEQQVNTEFALYAVIERFCQGIMSLWDPMLQKQVEGLRHVALRLIGILEYQENPVDQREVIFLSKELGAPELMRMQNDNIKAYISIHGSKQSDIAFIAKAFNIPTIIQLDMD